MKNMMEIPMVNGIFAEISERQGRPEFRDLVREIGEQIETQAAE